MAAILHDMSRENLNSKISFADSNEIRMKYGK